MQALWMSTDTFLPSQTFQSSLFLPIANHYNLCSFSPRIYKCTHHECQLGKWHSSQTTGSRTTCLSNIILYTASILHYASAEPIKLQEPHGQPVDAVHSCMSVCTIPSFPIQASIIDNIKCSCDFLQWAEGILVDFHTHTPWSAHRCRALPWECAHHPKLPNLG